MHFTCSPSITCDTTPPPPKPLCERVCRFIKTIATVLRGLFRNSFRLSITLRSSSNFSRCLGEVENPMKWQASLHHCSPSSRERWRKFCVIPKYQPNSRIDREQLNLIRPMAKRFKRADYASWRNSTTR